MRIKTITRQWVYLLKCLLRPFLFEKLQSEQTISLEQDSECIGKLKNPLNHSSHLLDRISNTLLRALNRQ